MRIRWTILAADDLESIKNYLQKHFPQFAEPTVRTIYLLVLSKRRHTEADPATAAAQGNCPSRRSPMSSSTR
jgi:hypothetical protein